MSAHLELQEARYRAIREIGRAVDYAGRSFEHFDLRPFFEAMLPQLVFPQLPPRVLEYGTGTGPGACYLAARGFQVDAFDLSPTAIELAKQFAAERGLSIRYEVADMANFDTQGRRYDLIVDNFCLHCVAREVDRARVFANVQAMLAESGYFMIGTTLARPDRDVGKDLLDPESGVRYQKRAVRPEDTDAICRDGSWYVPIRRYVTAAVLRSEVERAGFAVLVQEGGRLLCRPVRSQPTHLP